MKIEISYEGDLSGTNEGYSIYNKDTGKRISNTKSNFNKFIFDIEDIIDLLNTEQFAKFNNEDIYIFNVPKYIIDYVSTGMCSPAYYNKLPKHLINK